MGWPGRFLRRALECNFLSADIELADRAWSVPDSNRHDSSKYLLGYILETSREILRDQQPSPRV
mgnify:FL=1